MDMDVIFHIHGNPGFASNWAVGGGRLSGYMIFGIGNLLGLGGGWGRSSNFDLASLPPCRSALQQHIYRSNYQVGVWQRAHIAKPSTPDHDDGNGWTSENWCNAAKVDRWRSDAKRIGRHSRRINWRFWYLIGDSDSDMKIPKNVSSGGAWGPPSAHGLIRSNF